MLRTLIASAFAPALITGVVLWLGAGGWRRQPASAAPSWLVPVALAAGYVVGHLAISGPPPLPPVETSQWLVLLVAAAGVLGAVAGTRRSARPQRWAGATVLVGALLGTQLRPLAQHSWTLSASAFWLGALGAAALTLWYTLDHAAREQSSGLALPLSLLLVSGATAATLGLSGSARLGLLAGALAGALGAGILVARRSTAAWLAPNAISVIIVALVGLWLNGYLYAELRAVVAVPLALATAAPAIRRAPLIRDLDRRYDAVVLALVTLVLLAPALSVAAVDWLTIPGDPYDYDY